MHAAGIQIRKRNVGDLCDLSLQAERALHDVGRVQVRTDLVNRLCRWGRRGYHRRDGISRIGHDVLLLCHAVQPIRIEDQVLGETVVEQAKTAAQYGFWRALSPTADAPGKTEPWRPVPMIVNRVLRFKTQPTAHRESGTHLPVILYVQSGIHHSDWHGGRRAAGCCIDRKLARSKTVVSREAGKDIRAIESSAGRIDLVNRPQTPSEF